ncbi:hypothetical protein halTADL_0412 [Halohasta litchfieldiae]|jgi:hypothetical protein|uniref:Uncharacterized protein n=1 Tax=Halohasta litchfieldiae TaxID=1073996 RepID=A0A1H6W6P9_9EURY|nr:hypothetical protein halTADL_0412 [Halohasta litchfieldiae]SEJ08192.1 hypothetical protein SAMN05444271_1205 [Halohasta litchfieldiae]
MTMENHQNILRVHHQKPLRGIISGTALEAYLAKQTMTSDRDYLIGVKRNKNENESPN